MRIEFSPQDTMDWSETAIRRSGSVLTINGEDIDLTGVAAGERLYNSQQWQPEELEPSAVMFTHPDIVGDIEVTEAGPVVRVRMPIPTVATPEARFPEPIVDPADGPIALPA